MTPSPLVVRERTNLEDAARFTFIQFPNMIVCVCCYTVHFIYSWHDIFFSQFMINLLQWYFRGVIGDALLTGKINLPFLFFQFICLVFESFR